MPLDLREKYRAKGWTIFPLAHESKEPRAGVKWSQNYRGDWQPGDGIGVALGKRSGDLVDLDLDWHEAIDAARSVIGDANTAVFGRTSKPNSHYLFNSAVAKTIKFTLPPSFLHKDVPDEHALTVCELRTNRRWRLSFPE